MKKYQIWNRTDNIITPIGEVLTPEQWIARKPLHGVATIVPVIAAGEINGAIFGTLGQMVQRAANDGCDFTNCITDEEKLARIEAFEEERALYDRIAAEEAAANEELNAMSLASIAASMEYQNMLTLEDVEV